jgi:hypothetical protein
MSYVGRGDFFVFLDEDNYLEPEHLESLVRTLNISKISANDAVPFSLRKIVNDSGDVICNDDCESLGNWESVIGDYLIDVNCFFMPKSFALQLSPFWYRRARNLSEQPEVDRLFTQILRDNNVPLICSGEYTVKYRAGNREDSVQSKFFIQGNEIMVQKYQTFPWRKTK